MSGVRGAALVALTALLLTGCAAGPAATSASASPSVTRVATPTMQQRAAALVDRMSLSERAGQVLMTGSTVAQLRSSASLVSRYHLAGLMVRGRSAAGTRAVASALRPALAAAPSGLPLITATDQEGGFVQVLSGPGFAVIPSAVRQGAWSTGVLRRDARSWGRSLAAAGVRLDLAPVADVPCAATLHDNPPIAALRRQYGSDPAAAGAHVAAFVEGMADGGVATTVKHFPGLGCVRANTDTTARVVDSVTTETSPRLASFAAGIRAGAPVTMVSSAIYSRIDPGVPALFSSRIIGGLLRQRMGFDGVVMSDDTGAAKALAAWTPAQRVVRFLSAGGDLLLDVVPAHVPALHAAVVDRARKDPAFAARLADAADRVVAERLRLAR